MLQPTPRTIWVRQPAELWTELARSLARAKPAAPRRGDADVRRPEVAASRFGTARAEERGDELSPVDGDALAAWGRERFPGARWLVVVPRPVAAEAIRYDPTPAIRRLFDAGIARSRSVAWAMFDVEPPATGALEASGAPAAVARTTLPVLIRGESGTGKELAARAIHRASGRGAFVAVNCGGLPDGLVESELFGARKGAFTGADANRPGLVRLAADGTLFLDEVAELSPGAQASLLRALDCGFVRPLGAEESLPVKCRFIAATHRPLERDAAAGRFRRDLLHRLRGFEIALPPLREAPGRAIRLAREFVTRASLVLERPDLSLGADAEAALVAAPWPGNVRELRHAVMAAALRARGSEIGPLDLFPHGHEMDAAESGAGFPSAAAVERAHILRAMAAARGNRSAAAGLLGLSRQSLSRRLARHGIAPEDPAPEASCSQPESSSPA